LRWCKCVCMRDVCGLCCGLVLVYSLFNILYSIFYILYSIFYILCSMFYIVYTLSTALKFALKFFRKRSFFDQNQQPLNNVEPFERILRALFIAQCPYKFSSFLDLRNGSSRFQDFRRFRFSFSGSAFFSKVPPPGNLQS